MIEQENNTEKNGIYYETKYNNDSKLQNNQSNNVIEEDSLAFNSKLLLNTNHPMPRKESAAMKYSIDLTSTPKLKIQQYLNNDLIDELDKVPEENYDDRNIMTGMKSSCEVEESYINKKVYQGKAKKPFEIREGDWTCFDCHNLNFSFRKKCNRCGLDREASQSKFFNAKNEIPNYEGYYNNSYYYGYNNQNESNKDTDDQN